MAYRLAGIDGIQDYLPFADRALKGIDNNLGDDGWLRNVVDPYVFFRPGGHSPEAQAFVVLLQAAYRDHLRT